jgi:hypothetical protein
LKGIIFFLQSIAVGFSQLFRIDAMQWASAPFIKSIVVVKVQNISYIRCVKKQQITGLGFIIDKLTNSIENTFTGEVFDTEITFLTNAAKKSIKKSDWQFDWLKEIEDKSNATHFRGQRMFIETSAALKLISQYFKS